MPRTDTRTCTKCKNKIEFDLDNISGIVRFNNLFYHSECFVEYCKGRAAKSSSPIWQKHIDNMTPFENAAKEMISYKRNKDDLNEWILNHYDISSLPKRFWNVIAELENGIYNSKKCKPVSTELLFNTWRWGQKNLDKISRRNRMANKGPKTDAERINYDLAIIISHVPDYLKVKSKHDAEEAERRAREKEKIKINYNNITSALTKTEGLDDISDLLDEF